MVVWKKKHKRRGPWTYTISLLIRVENHSFQCPQTRMNNKDGKGYFRTEGNAIWKEPSSSPLSIFSAETLASFGRSLKTHSYDTSIYIFFCFCYYGCLCNCPNQSMFKLQIYNVYLDYVYDLRLVFSSSTWPKSASLLIQACIILLTLNLTFQGHSKSNLMVQLDYHIWLPILELY